jgi:hypothetical protein
MGKGKFSKLTVEDMYYDGKIQGFDEYCEDTQQMILDGWSGLEEDEDNYYIHKRKKRKKDIYDLD